VLSPSGKVGWRLCLFAQRVHHNRSDREPTGVVPSEHAALGAAYNTATSKRRVVAAVVADDVPALIEPKGRIRVQTAVFRPGLASQPHRTVVDL